MRPDADYGSQFSVGGLIQDTIQQSSNRFKGPAKESTTEDLSQGLCDPTNLKIIQLEPQLKPNFFEAANSISFRS